MVIVTGVYWVCIACHVVQSLPFLKWENKLSCKLYVSNVGEKRVFANSEYLQNCITSVRDYGYLCHCNKFGTYT